MITLPSTVCFARTSGWLFTVVPCLFGQAIHLPRSIEMEIRLLSINCGAVERIVASSTKPSKVQHARRHFHDTTYDMTRSQA